MLNMVAGAIGLGLQAALFAGSYLLVAPRRGRPLALLCAAMIAVDGYALVLLGAMLLGLPWQSANIVLAVLAGVALLAGAPMRARLRRSGADLAQLLRRHWGAIAILAAAVLVHGVAAALAPELSIDGQLYHGPTLAQLVQQGTLWGWEAPNQYLYYTDLTMVSGINLATFTGAAVFDNGIQIPHLVILVLAITAALRLRFRSSWVRYGLAALMVAAPVAWIQPRILYVDVAYAAAIVTIVVLIATVRHPGRLEVAIAAIAGAAIVAIKPAGILTGGLLLLAFAATAVWRMRRDGSRWWPAVGGIVAVFAPAAALASGFYVRNLVTFGNPVYPVKTTLGPLQLPGIIDLSVFSSLEGGSGLIDPRRWAIFATGLADGMLRGVTKQDYDPRSGGFGYMPLVVLLIVVAIVIAQLVVVLLRRRRGNRGPVGGPWAAQGIMALAALGIVLVQPLTYDSRYVIGPTILLTTAVLLTTITSVVPRGIDLAAGALALVAATAQVVWTEATVYPGLADIRELRALPDVYQPITPGSVFGRGESVAWLPEDGDCRTITLQTSGGLSAQGMDATTTLATFPYGLYGPSLCNEVDPVQIETYESSARTDDPIPSSDYLLLHSDDLDRWEDLLPDASECWIRIQEIPGNETYPTSLAVLRNECR